MVIVIVEIVPKTWTGIIFMWRVWQRPAFIESCPKLPLNSFGSVPWCFFPPWSVSMGPWYPFSYMIAMNIDLYGQLSDWFILWIIIHAYEADRSCVNTVTIDMNSKDCWYEHVIVNMNIDITQMNDCSTPWTLFIEQPMSYKWTDDRWYESQLSYLISWHFHVIMNDFMTPNIYTGAGSKVIGVIFQVTL